MARKTRRRSWRALVKRLGVMGAAKARRAGRRHHRRMVYRHNEPGRRVHRRRHYRRHHYRRNPGIAGALSGSPFADLLKVETYVDAVQYTGGALAALAFPRVVNLVVTVADKGAMGYLMNLGGAAVAGLATSFIDRKLSAKVFVGGLVATGLRIALDVAGPTLGIRPMSGLSAAQEKLESEIADEVRKALGVSDFPTRADSLPMNDFPTRAEPLPMSDFPSRTIDGFPTRTMGGEEVIPVDEAA